METDKAVVTGATLLILENQQEVDNLVTTLKQWKDGDTTTRSSDYQYALVQNIIQLLEAE